VIRIRRKQQQQGREEIILTAVPLRTGGSAESTKSKHLGPIIRSHTRKNKKGSEPKGELRRGGRNDHNARRGGAGWSWNFFPLFMNREVYERRGGKPLRQD